MSAEEHIQYHLLQHRGRGTYIQCINYVLYCNFENNALSKEYELCDEIVVALKKAQVSNYVPYFLK